MFWLIFAAPFCYDAKLAKYQRLKYFRLRGANIPVRDALIRLAEAGLVHALPQRGTEVTRIAIDSDPEFSGLL